MTPEAMQWERAQAHCSALLNNIVAGGWANLLEPGNIGYRCILQPDLFDKQVELLNGRGYLAFDPTDGTEGCIWVTLKKKA